MSGPLVALAAKGAPDAHLTDQPEITYFKDGYKRYTNFSVSQIEQQFNSSVGYGRKITAVVSRNGDLINEMYFMLTLSALVNTGAAGLGDQVYWTNSVGHAIIEFVEVEIGGHRFDRHQGDFMEIWETLSHPPDKGLGELVGFFTNTDDLVDFSSRDQTLFIPIRFWYNRFHAQALPLIALQYHEVRINIKLRNRSELVIEEGGALSPDVGGGGEILDAKLLVNYVYLDTHERRMFAQQPHEYLIDQLQFTGAEAKPSGKTRFNIPLFFNHPTQELIWVLQKQTEIDNNRWFNYEGLTAGQDGLVEAKIQLNGHDLFQEREAKYFRMVQPLEHHTRIPDKFIYDYSFALDPEDLRPSGSVNLSRIDNVTLVLETEDYQGEIRIYARSKNVMKIISGMAGLKYAN